ncbi:MAG: helix-turn-helix domain-containing protein [Armatimonadota bacterium]|nr:helix-turn-helix domain-containing protein [Armatimonadota bacterium]
MLETRLLRITEAAARAGIGRSLAYEFVRSGEWPSVKIGRALRIPLALLDEWIDAKVQDARERALGFAECASNGSVASSLGEQGDLRTRST